MDVHEKHLASLDLTHVLYNDASYVSLGLALITLSPILLMASYAALVVQTREFLVITMWAGQFAGELLNWVIKRIIREKRPIERIGNGYAFPSSHSQYMAYFSSFLICHLYFRHKFSSTGYPVADAIWRLTLYLALLLWPGLVAYSRYSLGYHNFYQIYWGVAIGTAHGLSLYLFAVVIPTCYPNSIFGRAKKAVIDNSISTWLQIRDGWAIWPDGGRAEEWQRWRSQWEALERTKEKSD